jgi:DHA1 family bicyclomycin/chloramphenicol resistance-like MFS transporter
MKPDPRSARIAALLTGLVALGPLSTDLYLPSLPSLTGVFNTDVAHVQLTLSVFLLGFAVSQLIYGPLSDRFGRVPMLIGGLAIYLLASIACVFSTSIEALIAARFFQALGGCCGPVLEDCNPGETQAIHALYLGQGGYLPARVRALLDFLAERVRLKPRNGS